MRVLDNVSPFWLTDPQLMLDEKSLMTEMITSTPNMIHWAAEPVSPLPVPLPDMNREGVARRSGMFQLPFVYLPVDVWAYWPGETLVSYQLRVLHTLAAMGLIGIDEQNIPCYVNPAPGLTAGQANEYSDRMDGFTEDRNGYDTVCDQMEERLHAAYPDGYPAMQLANLWKQHAPAFPIGSAVLTAHRALALSTVMPEESVRLLKLMKETFGPVFSPADMTPAGVAKWVDEHRVDSNVMLNILLAFKLDDEESVNLINSVLDERP